MKGYLVQPIDVVDGRLMPGNAPPRYYSADAPSLAQLYMGSLESWIIIIKSSVDF